MASSRSLMRSSAYSHPPSPTSTAPVSVPSTDRQVHVGYAPCLSSENASSSEDCHTSRASGKISAYRYSLSHTNCRHCW